MLIMIGCNIEYNGSIVGNIDHGGLTVGPNIGYALPGTILHGAHLIGCWFENNKGREQINFRSGATSSPEHSSSCRPLLDPRHRPRGRDRRNNRRQRFLRPPSNMEMSSTTGRDAGRQQDHIGLRLYNLKINRDLWAIERILVRGRQCDLETACQSLTNTLTTLNWDGPLVDDSATCFSFSRSTRMTVPARSDGCV